MDLLNSWLGEASYNCGHSTDGGQTWVRNRRLQRKQQRAKQERGRPAAPRRQPHRIRLEIAVGPVREKPAAAWRRAGWLTKRPTPCNSNRAVSLTVRGCCQSQSRPSFRRTWTSMRRVALPSAIPASTGSRLKRRSLKLQLVQVRQHWQ